MKQVDDKLTLQEIEQLCSMYIDCDLSVFEETELKYLLTQVDYHSPLIDEVRQIMAIDSYISDKSYVKANKKKKHIFSLWPKYISIAHL